MQLAMYTAMRAGPLSVVLVCGQRLWRLPPQLLGCTHCLIWPWDTEAVRAHVSPYTTVQLRHLLCRYTGLAPLHGPLQAAQRIECALSACTIAIYGS